jgi:hypothetical protein
VGEGADQAGKGVPETRRRPYVWPLLGLPCTEAARVARGVARGARGLLTRRGGVAGAAALMAAIVPRVAAHIAEKPIPCIKVELFVSGCVAAMY